MQRDFEKRRNSQPPVEEDQSLEKDRGEIDPNQPQFGWPQRRFFVTQFFLETLSSSRWWTSVVARSSGDAASQVRHRKTHRAAGQHRRCLHQPDLRAPRRGAPSQRTSVFTALRAVVTSKPRGNDTRKQIVSLVLLLGCGYDLLSQSYSGQVPLGPTGQALCCGCPVCVYVCCVRLNIKS